MRTCNEAGKDLIKRFEGCRLKSYLDAVKVPTVGYGHTGKEVKLGQTITQHQADVMFEYDVEKYAEAVDELTSKLGLSDNQFAACVSLAYNIGATRFASSTLLKKLRRGDAEGAAAEFGKWVLAGGVKLPGLVARRAAEQKLFQTA